jgi:outer membrane protein, heavy metal efflux system
MKKIILISCFALFACFADAQQTMTLSSIFENIEKNNPLLQSYTNRIEADKAMVGTANTWNAPKAGVEFDANPYSLDNFYSGVVRTSVSQEFPNRSAVSAKREYLESLSEINMHESMFEKNKLFTEAKDAYYAIYISQKKIKVTKDNMSLLKSMIELSEKQMATGKEELATIFKLKARLAEKEAMLIHDENMIKANIATLNYLMNVDVNQTFEIDTTGITKDYRNLLCVFTKDSIEAKRSDIMQMGNMISSMKLNKDVIASRSKPVFGMKFEHFGIPNKPDKFSVMGTVTIPFAPWSARGYKSEGKALNFRIAAVEQEKQNMVNMTSQMIKMLVIEMNSEYQEIDNYTQKVIPAYKKSMDAYMLAYGQNTSNLLMVLMAYDDLQMAQMEYIKHFETLLKVQVDYEKELQIR